MKVYLVHGSQGEYEDHETWVVSVHAKKEGAQSRIDLIKKEIADVMMMAKTVSTIRPRDVELFNDPQARISDYEEAIYYISEQEVLS